MGARCRARVVGVESLGAAFHVFVLILPALLVSSPSRVATSTMALFLVLATGFYLADRIGLRPRDQFGSVTDATPDEATGRLALRTGIALLTVLWVASVQHALLDTPSTAGAALGGSLLMVCGIALRYAAIRTLGRFFVTDISVTQGQPLVDHGVYRWVRHPSELGNLCFAFGACVVLESATALLFAVLILLPLVFLRVRSEDRFLRHAYGQAYRAYEGRVGGLIPFWRAHGSQDGSLHPRI